MNNTEEYYVDIINSDENNFDAYYNLGVIYKNKNDDQSSELFFKKAIELNPSYIDAYEKLADLYAKHSLQNEMIECFIKLGTIYFAQNEFLESIEYFDKIISIDNNNFVAYNNLGSCYQQLNNIEKAKEFYLKSLKINPNYVSALYNISYVYMIQKEYIIGFEKFRHRYNPIIRGNSLGGVAYPPTLLTPDIDISGKRVYISHEQGLGDTIQFIRFIPFFLEKGADIVCYVPPSLKKLFEYNYSDVEFILPENEITFDYNFPMLESPYLLGMKYENIPFGDKYLELDKKDVQEFRKKHNFDNTKIKIGINYRGSQGVSAVKDRSIDLELFIDYLNKLDNNIQFYSLQYERTPQEDALLEKNNIINLGSQINNFYDTALMIDAMDIIVSIDTSVLHLCGAMGKESYAMLKFSADWRWGVDDTKSKWYDSINIIRQKTMGDWDGVFNELIQALKVK
ncbi:tetratricopeptide repeat protein [Sulfurimonas sp.]